MPTLQDSFLLDSLGVVLDHRVPRGFRGPGAFEVEGEQGGENLVVYHRRFPPIRGEDRLIERPMGLVEPGRAGVVQGRQRPLFEVEATKEDGGNCFEISC